MRPAGARCSLHESRRRDQFDADLLHLLADRGEDGLGVAALQPCEEEERLEIRPQVKKVFRRDLACHHRVPHTALFQKREQLPKLTDAQPLDVVHLGGEPVTRLIGE